MNFWRFLDKTIDRFPKFPTERQWVTILLYGLAVGMLMMAHYDKSLWREELFKTLITVVIITGFINLVLSFHFSANKSDEDKTMNTGKMADAMKEQAITTRAAIPDISQADVILEPGEIAQAAERS